MLIFPCSCWVIALAELAALDMKLEAGSKSSSLLRLRMFDPVTEFLRGIHSIISF